MRVPKMPRAATLSFAVVAGLAFLCARPSEAQMRVATGSYVGTGTAGTPITVGFAPDVVFVKAEIGGLGYDAVGVTSTMPADQTKLLGQSPSVASGLIQSLTPTGFVVGGGPQVNTVSIVYHWTALKAALGEMEVGSYTGDGLANKSIPVAFQPDWVLVIGRGAAQTPVHRNSAMTGDSSAALRGTFWAPPADRIKALVPGGFQVGTHVDVNNSVGPDNIYHYVAIKKVPGRFNTGVYDGNSVIPRDITGVGFLPSYVIVKTITNAQAGVHRPDSQSGGESLYYVNSAKDVKIAALEPDGFRLGAVANVNAVNNSYIWVAFGGNAKLRSIGTAADYVAGTVEGTPGSAVVTGSGTQWFTANRGRGDRILIDGTNYTIHSVDSQTQLRLTTAYVGTAGPGKAHTISRQYTTLQAWEDCISYQTPASCSYFQVPSGDLVADNRSEVGIAYDDAVGTDFAGGLVIDGSVTDAGHTITLTADGATATTASRDRASSSTTARAPSGRAGVRRLRDRRVDGDHGGRGHRRRGPCESPESRRRVAGAGAEQPDPQRHRGRHRDLRRRRSRRRGQQHRPRLHDRGLLRRLAEQRLARGGEPIPGPQQHDLRQCLGHREEPRRLGGATLLLRNNISFGSTTYPDYEPDPTTSLDPASSHNLSEDGTAFDASPAGNDQNGVTLAQIAFFSTTVGSENLHIRYSSVAREQGADLSSIFGDDIDASSRPGAPCGTRARTRRSRWSLYRSVGTNAGNLNVSARTVTISGTTATFSAPCPRTSEWETCCSTRCRRPAPSTWRSSAAACPTRSTPS